MKATRTIDPAMLDNRDAFADPFFARFALRTAAAPLELPGGIRKDYRFPTLYGDVTCAQAIFLCPWERAYSRMPHPLMKPVRMPRGRALVAFSCYVYRQVLGVAPYNEIAMTIPILADPDVEVPVLPVMFPGFPGAGYHVFSMPVTSLENQVRGVSIWGLPKVVQDIDIEDEGGDCVTRAADDDGRTYFTLRVPRDGRPTAFDQATWLYTRRGDEALRARTCFAGTFNVRKRMDLLWRTGVAADRPALELGDGPEAEVLRSLDIEPVAFQTRYAVRMNACFDLPDPDWKPTMTFR